MAQTELWCRAALLVMMSFVTGLSSHDREAIQLLTSLDTDPIEPFPPSAQGVRVVHQLASRMIGLVSELGKDVNQNLPIEAKTGMTNACEEATEALGALHAAASRKEVDVNDSSKFGAISKPDAEHNLEEESLTDSLTSFSVDRDCPVKGNFTDCGFGWQEKTDEGLPCATVDEFCYEAHM